MEQQSNRPVDWMEDTMARQADRLLRTALIIMKNQADAEDIVQDAFVKLIEKRPLFDSHEHEAAWLIRVTVNLCKDKLRSHWFRKTVSLLDIYPAQNEAEAEIVESISSLPEKYRAVIHLRYIEGYSIPEIADITHQKEAAVRKQHTRAKVLLKGILEE